MSRPKKDKRQPILNLANAQSRAVIAAFKANLAPKPINPVAS